MGKRRGRWAWDAGLDFDSTRSVLVASFAASRLKTGYFEDKKVGSYAVLLTQLDNGSRISEARDAVEMWSLDGVREHEVRVRKEGGKRRCDTCGNEFPTRAKVNTIQRHFEKTGHPPNATMVLGTLTRLMKIPSEIMEEDLVVIRQVLKSGLSVKSLVNFSVRNAGFSTHALRYANTTHMGLPKEKGGLGLNTQIIAKVQGRKNVNLVVDYFEKKDADAVLREMVK